MKPIKYIRTEIFKCTQYEFADMLEITQPVVSDMEKSGFVNSKHQTKIRDEATRLNLNWSDSLFFEIPKETA